MSLRIVWLAAPAALLMACEGGRYEEREDILDERQDISEEAQELEQEVQELGQERSELQEEITPGETVEEPTGVDEPSSW